MNMKFRNYCIVVLGDVDGTNDEITRISETDVKLIKAKGVVMATFTSAATPSELKTYFQSFNRNFFLFELGLDNYGVNLNDQYIYNHLFGEYEENGDLLASQLTTKLFSIINKSISGNTKEDIVDVETMTDSERNELLNQMLDKGVNNWTDTDKIIIEKLTKK